MQQNHQPWGLADPANPVSEILPGLFQGGTLREQVIDQEQLLTKFHEDPRPYDSVVTLYPWAAPVGFGVEERRFGFPDGDMIDEYIARIEALAEWAHGEWVSGRRVLIRCAGGMNRSGLVTALVLLRVGYSADDAVALIQHRRSPEALTNPSFVAYLRGR